MVEKRYFYTLVPHEHVLKVEITPFDDDLKALQNQVKGHLEHVTLSEELNRRYIDSWVNEEGKLINMKPSAIITTNDGEILDVICGPICFTRYDDEGYTHGLTDDDIDAINHWYINKPVKIIEWNNDLYAVMCLSGFVRPW